MIDTLANFLATLNEFLGGNLGVTLIFIGVFSRIIFTPLMRKQMDQSQKLRALQPQLDKLKKKYGHDKTLLAQEQAKLFQESGVNPAAGCLPMVVQIVIFAVLYNAITRLLSKGINPHFLWWDLTQPDVYHVGIGGTSLPIPGIIIILAGLSQLVLSKLMLPQAVAVEKSDSTEEKESKTDLMQDLVQAQSSMVYLFPIMFIIFGYQFPAGLSLYWVATTITAVIQQLYFSGPEEIHKLIPSAFLPAKHSSKQK